MKKRKFRLCAMPALMLMLICASGPSCAAAEPVPGIPATGDNSMLTPVLILLVLSAVGIAVLVMLLIRGRRK